MKSEIREIYKAKRSQMEKAEVLEKSRLSTQAFLASEVYRQAKTLMLYMPLGNETDTLEIVRKAFCDKKRVCFPVTEKETGLITPCEAFESTRFEKGAFSVNEPQQTARIDVSQIDTVLVPGIAFDRSGKRVGFGKGCYDRLLRDVFAVKVGYCYEFQICDEILAEEHDVRMDYLVTESGIIKCE